MVYRKTKSGNSISETDAVTTYDVANAVGISATTVSSILSGRNVVRVSESTRNRVLVAAKEMGYRRNNLAGALRTGRTNTIGIVSPLIWGDVWRQIRASYLASLLAAISIAAARAGMTSLTFIETSLAELSAGMVVDGRVDGVILFGMPMDLPGGQQWVEELYATHIPCAEIGSRFGKYQVHADNFGGAQMAVKHLLNLGHQRIGYWQAHSNMVSAENREAGFLSAVESARLSAICPVIESEADIRNYLHGPDRLTALFCYNDMAAVKAYGLIRDAGLRIPEDISIIGFDDSPYAEAVHPGLTSVSNPLTALAEAAVALVISQQEGKEINCPSILIETPLVLRESTAPPIVP